MDEPTARPPDDTDSNVDVRSLELGGAAPCRGSKPKMFSSSSVVVLVAIVLWPVRFPRGIGPPAAAAATAPLQCP